MRNNCARKFYPQVLRKLGLSCVNLSLMRKICSRLYLFPQCARLYLFPNAQCMCKICSRLYLFPQCARFGHDCIHFPNAQYMRKIVLLSPMCNICARFYHHLCTKHYHSAGHKIFYFLIQIDRSSYIQ